MKNSNLEKWLCELNEQASIQTSYYGKSTALNRLKYDIEKLISISLKEKMEQWEIELEKKQNEHD